MTPRAKTVLTIAGSDPSGGAGIQGDLKTFAAHGLYGMAVITAITVQNTTGVTRVHALDAGLVREQIEAVLADIVPDAIKIGMLGTAAIVRAVAEVLARVRSVPIVVDPVMRATQGGVPGVPGVLLDDDGVDALVRAILPIATVVTPNILEAERLTGVVVRDLASARQAAERLVALGARAAVVTGGHLGAPPLPVTDVIFDGRHALTIASPRVVTTSAHGTGCAYASAFAARLAHGDGIEAAARAAQAYVAGALRRAPGIGRGRGPIGHA